MHLSIHRDTRPIKLTLPIEAVWRLPRQPRHWPDAGAQSISFARLILGLAFAKNIGTITEPRGVTPHWITLFLVTYRRDDVSVDVDVIMCGC